MNIRKRIDEHINPSVYLYIYKSLQRCKKKKNNYIPQQKSNEITKTKNKKDIRITQSYIQNKKCIFYVLIDVFFLFYSSILDSDATNHSHIHLPDPLLILSSIHSSTHQPFHSPPSKQLHSKHHLYHHLYHHF